MSSEDLAIAGVVVLSIIAMKYQDSLNYIASGEWLQPVYSVFSYWPLALFVIANIVGLSLVLVGAARAIKGVFSFRRDLANLHADLSHFKQESSSLKVKVGMFEERKEELCDELDDSDDTVRNQKLRIKELTRSLTLKQEDTRIKVDERRPLHNIKDLNEAEKEFLLDCGFKKHKFVGIHTSGPQVWLLKKSSRESAEHFFLVHHITQYLESKAAFVELHETRGPDIVFTTLEGKKVALEIETGSWLKSKKHKVKEKVRELDRIYGENWAFVVTHSDLLKKYRAFGPTFTKGQVKDGLKRYFQ